MYCTCVMCIMCIIVLNITYDAECYFAHESAYGRPVVHITSPLDTGSSVSV